MLLSVFLFIAILFAATTVIYRYRPMPLSGAIALAFSCIIGLESVFLNILSFFHLVNRKWILSIHLFALGLWAGWYFLLHAKEIPKIFCRYYRMLHRVLFGRPIRLLVPLCILIGLTAWIYPPNNYDSLTYHMARVAHWIQNQSIDYYPTPIDRQNAMGPGAEYLVLFFQALTESDQLAPLVQFFSFILLLVSLFYLIRIIKLPKKWLPYVIIISSTAPIAIMQASNTKNDLVAALITLAILISGARLFSGKITKIKLFDFLMIGACCGVGFLVKPTALLAAVPVLMIGIIIQALQYRLPGISGKKILCGCLCALLAASVVAGPDLYRKAVHRVTRHEVYPVFSSYDADRMWNPVRVFAHNVPFPEETRAFLRIIGYRGDIITKDVFNLQEDMMGNPYQATALLAISLVTLILSPLVFRSPRCLPRLVLSFSPVAAWFLFGIMVRDQGWITRLEIPLFYLFPFSLVFPAWVSFRSKTWFHVIGLGLVFTGFLSLAYAGLVAAKVPARQLIPHYFWGERPGRTDEYYNNSGLKKDHDFFLKAVEEVGCERIGLIAGEDSPVYPLIWRAMISGKRVEYLRYTRLKEGHHVWHTDSERLRWPCMIYAAYGVVEHVPSRGTQWIPAGDYHTFFRNLEWEFSRSAGSILSIGDSAQGWEKVKPAYHSEVSVQEGELIVISTGNDPQILLPTFFSGKYASGVMKIEMSSPSDTTIQLYYKTKKNPEYEEGKSVKAEVKKGNNTLYLFLPLDEIMGAIRLDPGKDKGFYRIRSVEIRGI